MSSTSCDEEDAPRIDKGKARAATPEPTEQTPLLLASSSTSPLSTSSTLPPHRSRSRPITTQLLLIFLATLSATVVLGVLFASLAYSYGAPATRLEPSELLSRALVVQGPDHVSVTSAEPRMLSLAVNIRAGIDAGAVIGLRTDEDPDAPDALPTYAWKRLGDWAVRRVGRLRVTLEQIDIVTATGVHLARVTVDRPVQLRLHPAPPRAKAEPWLEHVVIPLRISPTAQPEDLVAFARESWESGKIDVRVRVAKVTVRPGAWWQRGVSVVRKNIDVAVRKQIPTSPGIPGPGRDAPVPDMSQMVKLQSFKVTSGTDTMLINALALIINPLHGSTTVSLPSLPFAVSLRTATGMAQLASVDSAPLELRHKNESLAISGQVTPPTPESVPFFASFISAYLSGTNNPVVFSSPLYPGLALDADFPGPERKPQVLRNVQLKDMRLHAQPSGEFLASGLVLARVVLPRGFHPDLVVGRVLPDVLVFDGPVPTTPLREEEADFPQGAFARIRPDDWVPSLSEPMQNAPEDGATVNVTARFVDVPLDRLPGRERQFTDFVTKVVFNKEGALAGLMGSVAVAVQISGLPGGGERGEVELAGLPFQASVKIGKGSL